MAEDRYTFAQARARLEDIVVQVRKKDTSLEKSLDLLEEGVRLANACTELSDHTEWRSVAAEKDVETADTVADTDEAGQEGVDTQESVVVDRAAAEQDLAETEASDDQEAADVTTDEAEAVAAEDAGDEDTADDDADADR